MNMVRAASAFHGRAKPQSRGKYPEAVMAAGATSVWPAGARGGGWPWPRRAVQREFERARARARVYAWVCVCGSVVARAGSGGEPTRQPEWRAR